MSRTIAQPRPPLNLPLDQVQHVVLEGISWGSYEKLLKEIGDRPLRVTFDEGSLEIMSPLPEHEHPKRFIGRLIEMLAFTLDRPVTCLGSTTFRRRDKQKGLEPDECYFFENEAKVRGLKRWNPRKDPPPDLVVEVDIFSRSIDREPIYAALGVPELWRYDGQRLQCLQLSGDHYTVRRHSRVFPFLEVAQLQQFLAQLPDKDENSILREFIAWVKKST
ncbi:MAG: Uma2 family endonuclease [Tepidisphaerales bacterium]